MKFLSLLSAFALISSAFGQLTPLEIQWDVQDPTLSISGNTFTITTVHGVGVDWVSMGTYDVCPNGDADYNNAEYQGSPFSYFLTNLDFIDGNSFAWSGPTGGYWTNAWSFIINTAVMANSALYTESGGVGTVEFCMRYGLVDTDAQQAVFTLVNFRQMLVQITFDLTNDFTVTGFYTQAIDEVIGTINQEFTVSHGLCDGLGDINNPYNQGQEICYYVCPDDAAARVLSFETLFLEIDDAPNDAQQTVLNGGSPVGNIVGTVQYDVDSNGNNVANCAQVGFLLLGLFFPVDAVQNPPPVVATVTGSGDVILSLIPIRKLKEGRQLEETHEVKFEPEFKIMQYADNNDSGASSLLTMAGVAGAMGAALLL